MSSNKYKHVRVNGKKMTVHRHVMQVHLGRDLLNFEHVYHINGDSYDNSIENLIVITKKERQI